MDLPSQSGPPAGVAGGNGTLASLARSSRCIAAVTFHAMTTQARRKPRTFTHDHRRRLDRAAENYLRECYRRKKPARAKDFAKTLGLTPEYVSWLGARILGSSLQAFLRKKQLDYAARLLKTTPLSIEEIAARCGFGTRSTMYRWFVAQYGLSPAAFRELKK